MNPIKHSLAAVHIIQKRIARVVLVISLISTFVFISFYSYMIYTRVNNSSPHIIIYSTMILILVISTIFDIIFYPGNNKIMDLIEKRRLIKHKTLKRHIINTVKVIVKAFSLAYATYELVNVDNTTGKLLSLIVSYSTFVVQILSYFIADFFYKYSEYLILAIKEDKNGILKLSLEARAAEEMRTDSEKAILKEINDQIKEDSKTKKKDDEIRKKAIANKWRKRATKFKNKFKKD